MIPISVLVCVKNEGKRIARCLDHLRGFDEVVVVASGADKETADIVESYRMRIEYFTWNGLYPKKRQWSLDHISLKHERILFVDADEIVTPSLIEEIKTLDWKSDGYFIKGQPFWRGHILRHGLWNNKLVLFNRHKFRFPEVNDLDLAGSMEIEGHYQPIGMKAAKIGALVSPMLHDCAEGWDGRHQVYADWEAGMLQRKAYPVDPLPMREKMKRIFRAMPFRGAAMLVYGYGVKRGFLDGREGLDYALSKARYYAAISRARKKMARSAEE